MNISAINNQLQFKGHYNDANSVCYDVPVQENLYEDKLDRIDFYRVEDSIKKMEVNNKNAKVISPLKYFLLTATLALGAFVTARKFAGGVLNKLDGTIIPESMNKFGEKISNKVNAFVTNTKKIVDNNSNKQLSYFKNLSVKVKYALANAAESILNSGAKVTANIKSEKTKELLEKGFSMDGINAKNAIYKVAANTIGAGSALVTLTHCTKDEDGNLIPDWEEGKKGVGNTLLTFVSNLADAIC